MIMLHHNHHHIHPIQKLIKIQHLVLHNLFLSIERIEALQRSGKMSLLTLDHLEGRGLTDIIHILLISDSIQAHPAVVSNAILFHNLINAVEHELRLAVVGAHTLVDNLGKARIVAHKEPRVNTDAVATYSGTWLKNVYAGVHVADLDNLIHIHIVVAADAGKFVGEGDVDCTEGVFDDFGHLGCADIGYDYLALAEGGIILFHLHPDLLAVGSDGAVVVEELIDHIAGDDALGGDAER